MPVTEIRPATIEDGQPAIETAAQHPALDTIGIEFEYPVADSPGGAPATYARRSRDLRDSHETGSEWHLDDNDEQIPCGNFGHDHVGTEIQSATLDLHTTEPEVWYWRTIERCEREGHPFAACGYGETVFGLHLHLSSLSEAQAEFLYDISGETWFRPFVGTSIHPDSKDPWRHGGVGRGIMNGEGSFDGRFGVREVHRGEAGHFEWRVPEPMLPDHFGMLMHFLRLLATDGQGAARDYAEERVFDADDRLTAVQQYREYEEEEVWEEDGYANNDQTDGEAARFMDEIMS